MIFNNCVDNVTCKYHFTKEERGPPLQESKQCSSSLCACTFSRRNEVAVVIFSQGNYELCNRLIFVNLHSELVFYALRNSFMK